MKKYIFIFFIGWAAPAFLFSQQIHYVNSDANGANTGTSWQNAYTDLQSALQASNYGDDIWVAAGTYKPTQGDDRNITFDLPVGVRLAGGFAGTESLFGERDWESNVTVLSGDIGTLGVSEDNSYHVVRIYGGDSLTVLDGCSIMHGRTGIFNDPAPLYYGGGVLVWADALRPVSIPLIQHCRLEQNYAVSGGGIACVSQYDEYIAAPDVKNCLFIYNQGEYLGGSFSKRGKCLPHRPFKIEDCEFRQNYCVQLGGALAISLATGEVEFKNCSFVSDTVLFEAGAIFLESQSNVRYVIDNCVFSLNHALNGGGGAVSHLQYSISDTATIVIKTSLFSSNSARFNNGGAFGSGGFGQKHILIIDSTRFENNYSLAGGCGVYVEGGGTATIQVRIDHCLFLKNLYSNSLTGGGAFFYRGSVKDYNVISNSVFAYNDGAIATLGVKPGLSETNVVNCTFLNNGFVPFIKYWSPEFNTTDYYQTMQILNSVIWEEETPSVYRLFYNNNSSNFNVHDYVVEHCLVNLPDCEYAGIDPCGAGMLYDVSPQFVSTDSLQLDLSVSTASPVINRGSNVVADTFGLLLDYLGHPRISQDTVDIGAFEYDASSGQSVPFFEQESFMMQVRPNVTTVGQPIRLQLFNLSNGKPFVLRLTGLDGRERYRSSTERITAQNQAWYDIPTEGLPAGMYWLSVDDGRGRVKTAKVVVME